MSPSSLTALAVLVLAPAVARPIESAVAAGGAESKVTARSAPCGGPVGDLPALVRPRTPGSSETCLALAGVDLLSVVSTVVKARQVQGPAECRAQAERTAQDLLQGLRLVARGRACLCSPDKELPNRIGALTTRSPPDDAWQPFMRAAAEASENFEWAKEVTLRAWDGTRCTPFSWQQLPQPPSPCEVAKALPAYQGKEAYVLRANSYVDAWREWCRHPGAREPMERAAQALVNELNRAGKMNPGHELLQNLPPLIQWNMYVDPPWGVGAWPISPLWHSPAEVAFLAGWSAEVNPYWELWGGDYDPCVRLGHVDWASRVRELRVLRTQAPTRELAQHVDAELASIRRVLSQATETGRVVGCQPKNSWYAEDLELDAESLRTDEPEFAGVLAKLAKGLRSGAVQLTWHPR